MCTRAVYKHTDGSVYTGRTMDWFLDMGSNLWAFPAGIERDGCAGPDSFRWTSKYGSVVTGVWDCVVPDGMNEAGLVANMLYLAEAVYPDYVPGTSSPPLSLALWTQYMLDSFATVAEAVDMLRTEPFTLRGLMSPDGQPGTTHLSLSDVRGDSAIIEYINGEQVIHHSPSYTVMSNSPTFEEQLALDAYWQSIGGDVMLPGTARAADRFVRASYYIGEMTAETQEDAVAGIFSVMRNVSMPYARQPDPSKPNVSPTLFRTVSDHSARRYFYEHTKKPNLFWVDLADLDLSAGQPVRRLELTGGATYAGNTADLFEAHAPMVYLPAGSGEEIPR